MALFKKKKKAPLLLQRSDQVKLERNVVFKKKLIKFASFPLHDILAEILRRFKIPLEMSGRLVQVRAAPEQRFTAAR